ncbi:MAG: molybdenum cofactor guanylyltransferase [Deferribacteraceae bacterium]|jgi:molybdopterin-guanine dinucleotide biosynthesis protein A|nr:molybdenum cofactor guanylyltransferase [Deferribacteraceae bacterium]
MNLSIAILAGGMSRRFGADKTLALLDGRPLIQWVYDGATQISTDIMVIAKDPDKYDFLKSARMVLDVYEQQCAMVGIITALEAAIHDDVFVISADMPLFLFAALNEMMYIGKTDAIVPEIAGKLYPCAAIYRKSALTSFKEHYARQDFRLMNLFKAISVSYPTDALFCKYVAPKFSLQATQLTFINVNTQEDLARISLQI